MSTYLENRWFSRRREGTIADLTRSVKDPQVGVLLDSPNLLGGARQEFASDPATRAILRAVTKGRPWIGVACVARPISGKPIDAYLDHLEGCGFVVDVWDPLWVADRFKTDNDVQVGCWGTRMLHCTPIDELVLLSGDSDMRPLIGDARMSRKKLTVAGFPSSIAKLYRSEAHEVVELDERHVRYPALAVAA